MKSVEAQRILHRLEQILTVTDATSVPELIAAIEDAGCIFLGGAGRSLLVARCFGMRLMQAGYQVAVVADPLAPAIRPHDLLLLVSGTGRAAHLLDLSNRATSLGARVAVVTADKAAPLARSTELLLKVGGGEPIPAFSGMPMGSQFELGSLLLLEGLFARLLTSKGLTESDLRARHANLE